jgi:hypothetical protein
MPEEEPGYQQAGGVDTASNKHEVGDVHHGAMSNIVVLEEVVDKIRHVKFSLDWLLL